MIGMAGAWVLRPFGGAADHALVEELWSAALEPRWPLLPRAIAMVCDGFLAMDRGRAVGCVAVDPSGSIPLRWKGSLGPLSLSLAPAFAVWFELATGFFEGVRRIGIQLCGAGA